MRENKSAEIFPQHYTSSFGEIFPWRKFPAIRYLTKVDRMTARRQNDTITVSGKRKNRVGEIVKNYDCVIFLMMSRL